MSADDSKVYRAMDTRLCTSACTLAVITFWVFTTASAQISDSPYVSNGSLTFKNRTFYLDGNPLHILSGSLHYFRVVPEYWWDRMRKMKACGLNTLTLYAPWNQHEPYPGRYNFNGILDLRRFLKMAQRAGLYVIFRPGPYICSEWDFGGLPAWLLRDPDMKVRTNYHGYQSHVRRYFSRLMAEVSDLQYHRGGPIIAVQVENEFGSYSNDTKHLLFIKQTLEENGIHELFFTSDGFYNYTEGLNGLDNAPFYTGTIDLKIGTTELKINELKDIAQGEELFRKVEALDDDFPLMVTEYWSGWFDYWGGPHHKQSLDDFGSTLTAILNRSASINFYMFHGGTNFGFMSGANWDFEKNTLKTDVTSYDYDALLTEAGDITEKYRIARQIIHEKILGMPGLEIPYDTPKEDFGSAGRVNIQHYMPLENILKLAKKIRMNKTVPMELLPLHPVGRNSFSGQMYGYILYRTNITHGDNLTFTDFPRDRIEVFVDGNSVAVLEGMVDNVNVNISLGQIIGAIPIERVLDILVENRGRVNFGIFGASVLDEQLKGLDNNCFLDGQVLDDVDIYPLEFDEDFYKRLKDQTDWEPYNKQRDLPGFYRGHMFIAYTPLDSYLNMKGWTKGFVYVNGVNLGRYWNKGPQQTLFVPGPYLKQGFNEIIIFEQHKSHNRVTFQETYILDERDEDNS